MNRSAIFGMLMILGCVNFEQPDPLLEGSLAEISQGDTPVAQAVRVPPPPGCADGAFCAYAGVDFTGARLLATQGPWQGSIGNVKSVFNNGRRDQNRDHIRLVFFWNGTGLLDEACIHYNPGPGAFWINYPGGVRIMEAHWRGECPE